MGLRKKHRDCVPEKKRSQAWIGNRSQPGNLHCVLGHGLQAGHCETFKGRKNCQASRAETESMTRQTGNRQVSQVETANTTTQDTGNYSQAWNCVVPHQWRVVFPRQEFVSTAKEHCE